MGQASRFARNSFWLAASAAIVILIGAVYRPIIGRMLGPINYGQYSFIQTFVAYFMVLAYFGVRQVVVREIGKEEDSASRYLRASLRIRSVTVTAAMVLSCIIGYALGREHQVTVGIWVLSLSVAAAAIGDLLEGALVAFERSFYVAVASLIGNVLKLGLGVAALKAGYGIIGVLWVFVFTSAVTTGLDWIFVRRVMGGRKRPDEGPLPTRYVLSESAPFFVQSLALKLYIKIDIVFVTLLKGDRANGLYSAAYAFVDFLLALTSSVAAAAYPVAARLYAKDGEAGGAGTTNAYERLHKHMLLVLLPVSILLMLLSRQALGWVFGASWLGGVPAMRMLVWIPPIEVSALLSGTFLSAAYQQRLQARITWLNAVLSFGLMALLVPRYGGQGAAAAVLIASAANAALHYYYVLRCIGPARLTVTWVKPVVCGAVMLAVVHLGSDLTWPVRVLAGVGAYALAVLLVRAYDSEDRRLLLSLLRR